MRGVAKRHRVEESFRILVAELQRPCRTGVRRLVDPGCVTVADAEDVGRLRIDRVDVSKIELVRIGHGQPAPRRAAIIASDHRALGAAGPHDPLVDGADTTQTRGDTARLRGPGRRTLQCSEREKDGDDQGMSDSRHAHILWAKGDGRWAMGDGRWAMGDGRWAMGDGRWEKGKGLRAKVAIIAHRPSPIAAASPLSGGISVRARRTRAGRSATRPETRARPRPGDRGTDPRWQAVSPALSMQR